MSETIQFTKEELIEAFKLWNIEAIASPEEFNEPLSPKKEFAERQADCLMHYLESV